MSTLYVVSTPIGNLQDISSRALRTLSQADLILCEDTRTTKKLLSYYKIKTAAVSYHQHSRLKKINYIIELLAANKNLALVCDAGTPGISDPGHKLINSITEQFNLLKNSAASERLNNLTIVSVPGPSALTAAASVSGFPMDRFLFLGFPPSKRKRKKFFSEVASSKYPVIFYESPHRLLKTLGELALLISVRPVVVCRELTKKFETIYRGSLGAVIEELNKEEIKGELVVVISKLSK